MGLNLTYCTLLSVVKYFSKYDAGKNKKFIYDDDYDLLKAIVDRHSIKVRTLDVQIVDIADEIAYATHQCYDKLKEIVEKSREKSGYGKKCIDSMEYSKLFRQEISSALINLFITECWKLMKNSN